jgi:hypothetical protein
MTTACPATSGSLLNSAAAGFLASALFFLPLFFFPEFAGAAFVVAAGAGVEVTPDAGAAGDAMGAAAGVVLTGWAVKLAEITATKTKHIFLFIVFNRK